MIIEPVEAPAWVIQPGDRVLLAIDRALTLDTAQEIERQLAERFPGVDFTIIAGGLRVETIYREP